MHLTNWITINLFAVLNLVSHQTAIIYWPIIFFEILDNSHHKQVNISYYVCRLFTNLTHTEEISIKTRNVSG